MQEKHNKITKELLRKMIIYNCNRRGLKELEIILEQFNSKFLSSLDKKDLMLFRELLNLNDLDLYQRITSDKSKNAEKIKILDLLNKIFLKEK
jgi:succinate dehydrogenase flavin-adding protein (antitoxin of CptAB toxin-antitoxin module)|tara:strand:+ start:470 stop:748 length:279 start_codon:yes stop_codon:yes gene_type:complete